MNRKDRTVEPDVISVTPEEAARITRIPEHTIRQAMNARTLPHYDINQRVKVIPIERLKAWAESMLVGAGQPVHNTPTIPAAHSLQSKLMGRTRLAPGPRRGKRF